MEGAYGVSHWWWPREARVRSSMLGLAACICHWWWPCCICIRDAAHRIPCFCERLLGYCSGRPGDHRPGICCHGRRLDLIESFRVHLVSLIWHFHCSPVTSSSFFNQTKHSLTTFHYTRGPMQIFLLFTRHVPSNSTELNRPPLIHYSSVTSSPLFTELNKVMQRL